MNHSIRVFKLLVLVGFSFLGSCKHSETIVISKDPVFPGSKVDLANLPSEVNQTVIRVGELNKVQNLDPLFVNNHGEQRIIHLTCEGLVALNQDGTAVPAIAKLWEISSDSLVYKFTLANKRFHSSELFFNGLGRRIISHDVRFVFERMAHPTVPSKTAKMFWAIKGMDIFFNEQHEVYDPNRRSLESISGIQTPNDSTIIFRLDYKDSKFLSHLARPEASIYPKESTESKVFPLSKWPIGSNNWKFSGLFRDSIITLKPVEESTDFADSIHRKRIEFYFFQNEVSLYKKFFLGEIDIVPEIGPQLSKTVLTENGKLSSSYENEFNLISTTSRESLNLFFNPNNRDHISLSQVEQWFNQTQLFQQIQNAPVFDRVVKSSREGLTQNSTINPLDSVLIILSYDENPLAFEIFRLFYASFSDKSKIRIVKSPVYGRETVLFIREEGYNPNDSSQLLAKIFAKRSGLQKLNRVHASFSDEPWWISIH